MPALVENGEDRQVYDITTNKSEFRLYVKYRASKYEAKNPDYSSWVFTIKNDTPELKSYMDNGYKLVVALVCGKKNLGDSQLAVLDTEQITSIINAGKTTINVTIKKGEHAFRIPFVRDRESGLKVKCNRFEDLF